MSKSPPTRKAATPEAVLRRLEWTVIRRLDGVLHGDYRTLFRGFGLDLAGLREYQHHDDVRHIDWNVTARLQHPYVRQYNEDREVTAWFLLDTSPSVDFGSEHIKKRAVLHEFGVDLPAEKQVRVWDSTAELRYMVLPERPEGTEGMSEDELIEVISRDAMIGVALVPSPAGAV